MCCCFTLCSSPLFLLNSSLILSTSNINIASFYIRTIYLSHHMYGKKTQDVCNIFTYVPYNLFKLNFLICSLFLSCITFCKSFSYSFHMSRFIQVIDQKWNYSYEEYNSRKKVCCNIDTCLGDVVSYQLHRHIRMLP